jgi:hypothetical protein
MNVSSIEGNEIGGTFSLNLTRHSPTGDLFNSTVQIPYNASVS